MYYNLKISTFKKSFSLNEHFVNLKDNNEIHEHLLKLYRCYVISQKMQNAIRCNNYKLTPKTALK